MKIFYNIVIFFIIGDILILLLSFLIYGKIQKKYDIDKNNKKIKLYKKLLSIFILISSSSLIFLFDYFTFYKSGINNFVTILLFNILLVFLISLFDALFIDLFILVYWKPKFLNIDKDKPSLDYMKKHIFLQFTFGWIFKIVIAIIGIGLYFLYLEIFS